MVWIRARQSLPPIALNWLRDKTHKNRMSQFFQGACVGHVTPEAFLGGPIAFVEEGDTIVIDIPAGTIDLVVSSDVIEQRKKSWRVPEHTGLKKGTLLERYRRLVGPATRGATFE